MTKPRKCFKCSQPAAHQWRICSDGPWRWVCKACDLQLNYIAARWAFGPEKAMRILQAYKAKESTSCDT